MVARASVTGSECAPPRAMRPCAAVAATATRRASRVWSVLSCEVRRSLQCWQWPQPCSSEAAHHGPFYGRPGLASTGGARVAASTRSCGWHEDLPVMIPASQFTDIFHMIDEDVNVIAYQGKPLATCSEKRRGEILATLVRRIDSDQNPEGHVADPHQGRCVNGDLRGRGRKLYDWLRDGNRIECKSARFRWLHSARRWTFTFRGVKIGDKFDRSTSAFDELHLALYTPCGIFYTDMTKHLA